MKNGLMVVSTGVENKINIGDYVQALAAKQFFASTDIMLERETDLKIYKREPVKMIMNGWYMNHPENWPPSDKINPLFVALHINVCGLPRFLSEESVAYLKKYEPIGCRDTNSVHLLESKGVKAYFSGCLTLTLGHTYKSTNRGNKIYIVEPFITQAGLVEYHKIESLKTFIYLLTHYLTVSLVTKKKGESGFKSLFYNAFYLKSYSKVFELKILRDAEYINQYNMEINKQYPSQNEKLRYAEELVQKYAEAKCVITSRIHCALPCLGLGTPVIFIEKSDDDECSKSRFGGLIDLLNVLTWDGLKLHNPLGKETISMNNFPKNKLGWKPIAEKLIKQCTDFAKGY